LAARTERIARGDPMAGLFVVRQQGAALSRIIEEHASPDFDSSERDCRQNAVYSRQALSGSTT